MTDHSVPTPAAANSPPPASAGLSTLTPHAQVNNAILALNSAVTAASVAASGLEKTALNLLPQSVSQILGGLSAVNTAVVELSAAISLALTLPTPDMATPPLGGPTNAAPDPVNPTASGALNPAAPTPVNSRFIRTAGPWVAGTLYGVIPHAPLTAVPDRNEKWFSITRGKYVGLTTNSAISLNAVTGVPGGLSDRCNTQAEALQHFNDALGVNAVALIV